jgi:hypothetical protein
MSEYQYYEFHAVDRPLSKREMNELRELSSRAEITPTSLSNTYHYGDFRAKPEQVLERYFDAFVYVANWGTRRFLLRLPRHLVDVETFNAYCTQPEFAQPPLSLTVGDEYVIVEFLSYDEMGGGWEDGEGWMQDLLPIREELLTDDLRSLYLAWLINVENRELDDQTLEPPVPPRMRKLSQAQAELIKFLRIENDLVETAAQIDAGAEPAEPTEGELAAWLSDLPESEKNSLLLKLVQGEPREVRRDLMFRFRHDWLKQRPQVVESSAPRRTVAQLLEAVEAFKEEQVRQEAQARQRREQRLAAARKKRLDQLEGQEDRLWDDVDKLIETKKQTEYDKAVALLRDLRDLAQRSGRTDDFELRVDELRRQHRSKSSLLNKLSRAGFKASRRRT